MKLQSYRKEINKFSFKEWRIWDFHKGYYDDGNNQFVVSFVKDTKLSTYCKHYYRFHRFDDNDNSVYWLILNPFEQFRFQCIQSGIIKTLVSPIYNLIQAIKSLR